MCRVPIDIRALGRKGGRNVLEKQGSIPIPLKQYSRETVVVEVNGYSPLPGLCLSSLGGVSWLETTVYIGLPIHIFYFMSKEIFAPQRHFLCIPRSLL